MLLSDCLMVAVSRVRLFPCRVGVWCRCMVSVYVVVGVWCRCSCSIALRLLCHVYACFLVVSVYVVGVWCRCMLLSVYGVGVCCCPIALRLLCHVYACFLVVSVYVVVGVWCRCMLSDCLMVAVSCVYACLLVCVPSCLRYLFSLGTPRLFILLTLLFFVDHRFV